MCAAVFMHLQGNLRHQISLVGTVQGAWGLVFQTWEIAVDNGTSIIQADIGLHRESSVADLRASIQLKELTTKSRAGTLNAVEEDT
jgi:hypothetical protein